LKGIHFKVLNKLTEDAVLSASWIILAARYTLRDGANPRLAAGGDSM